MCVGRIKVLLERLEANGGGGGGTGEGEAVAIAAARRREPGGDWFRVDEKYKTRNSEMLRWGVYERASLSADPKHPVAGANADNEAAQLLVAAGWIDWESDAAAGASKLFYLLLGLSMDTIYV